MKQRLLKNRMYRLPNGELFWYYASWDRHGNLVGKVIDKLQDCFHNKMIHRSVLENAEVIPKGKEPWVPGKSVTVLRQT